MLNDKKQIFGWVIYDWANSAYVTTVTVALLPAYFAGAIVPPGGVTIGGTTYSATVLWGLTISFSSFFVFIIAPILGAISDFSAAKKKFLMTFCYTGSAAACLLFFCGPGDIWQTILLFSIAQIGFVGANIFYDAFLPEIASEDKIDWVSGLGFACGYVGGGLQFALALALIALGDKIGISPAMAARLGILMAALWWVGFSIISLLYLKETKKSETLPPEYRHLPQWLAFIRVGIVRLLVTLRKAGRFRQLLLFLVAYMIYTNGIQTVISMATIFGKEELKFSNTVLMLALLMIQFIGMVGALGFSKLAELISAKNALILTLIVWSLVVIYAYFMQSPTEYFIMSVFVGLVLGGAQSLSRSLYGAIIPAQATAEFYGFYSVFNKGSAILGPLAFALIRQFTGTARNSILGLIVFFITGLILLLFVDVNRAKATARNEI